MQDDVHVPVHGTRLAGDRPGCGPSARRPPACGSSLPLRMTRSRPGRSVTSATLSGRNAIVHGFSSPVANAVTRMRMPSPVSNSIGSLGSGRFASPVGATGMPIGVIGIFCWPNAACDPTATRPRASRNFRERIRMKNKPPVGYCPRSVGSSAGPRRQRRLAPLAAAHVDHLHGLADLQQVERVGVVVDVGDRLPGDLDDHVALLQARLFGGPAADHAAEQQPLRPSAA